MRLICLVGLAIIATLALVLLRSRLRRLRSCARCGASAAHGYSPRAESPRKDIVPLCQRCLAAQLEQDYLAYSGSAVVIQPASGLPCYVFRDREYLRKISPETPQLDREVWDRLQEKRTCRDCAGAARYLWVESKGLSSETFEEILKSGLAKTLLTWGNPPPLSVCGKCTVKRIAQVLDGTGYSYVEVCSPRGSDEGIVLPMAY